MFPDPIIEIGESIKIYPYGIMIATGVLVCFLVLFGYGKRMKIDERYIDFAFYAGIFSIVIGFLGAAIWQGTFAYIGAIREGREAKFSIDKGITAIGGISTGAVCFIIVALLMRKKLPFICTKLTVLAPCCMVIAHAFGRVGCFFAGCCFGKVTDSVFGVVFPAGSGAASTYRAADGRSLPVYPTQLYEAIFLFALFGVLSYLALKKNYQYNMVVYMVAYGIWRFLIEFLRGDPRGAFIGGHYESGGNFVGLSPSQIQSLVLIALAIPAYFLFKYYYNKMVESEGKAAITVNAGTGETGETAVNADVSLDGTDKASNNIDNTDNGAGKAIPDNDIKGPDKQAPEPHDEEKKE